MNVKVVILLVALLTIFGCNKTHENAQIESDQPQSKSEQSQNSEVDFSKYVISESSIGPIRIGMQLSEAESKLGEFKKIESKASKYGYGGGSPAFEYEFNKELVFALIPILDTDEILIIVGIHPELKTNLKSKCISTIAELEIYYPDLMINEDVMNGWEYFFDEENNWQYVFKTNESNRIAEFSGLETLSRPIRKNIESNWMIIRRRCD